MSEVKAELELNEAPEANDEKIVVRAMADPKLEKVAADAHHTFGTANSPNCEGSRADAGSMNGAQNRIITSEPESMDINIWDELNWQGDQL
eukprot:10467443-Alexandrium_andersonii.AAC.1